MGEEQARPVLAGVDMGGTKIHAVLTDDQFSVLARARCLTPLRGGPKAVLKAVDALLTVARSDAGVAGVAAIGMGMPGTIRSEQGTVAQVPHIADWGEEFKLTTALARLTAAPATILNDNDAFALGEALCGAGRGHRTVVGIGMGTGVGGGIVVDGQLLVGRGGGGEIGCIQVEPKGRRCSCGRRGCLEPYAGRTGIDSFIRQRVKDGARSSVPQLVQQSGRSRLSSSVLARAVRARDKVAVEAVEAAAAAMGVAVGIIAHLLDPDIIVIGGGLGHRLGQPFIDAVAAQSRPYTTDRHFAHGPCEIRLTQLADDAGAVGAAVMASRALHAARG